MREKWTLEIGTVKRQLPMVALNDKLGVYSFVMLGDTELVCESARELVKLMPRYDIDIIVAPEAKAIPIAQEVSRLLMINYAVIRKSVKPYMKDPVIEEVTQADRKNPEGKVQTLVLDGSDAERLSGRNVCILDDVVSTGGSMKSIKQILSRIKCNVVCEACVLLEEGGYESPGLIYLKKLPVCKM